MELHRFKDQRLDGEQDKHYTYLLEHGRPSVSGYFSFRVTPMELLAFGNVTVGSNRLDCFVALKNFPFRPFVGVGGYDVNEVINATAKNKYRGRGEWEVCFPRR